MIIPIHGAFCLRCNPQTVTTVQPELLAAGFTEIVCDFIKLIFTVTQSIPEYARANIGKHPQLDMAITNAINIVPAVVAHSIDLDHCDDEIPDSRSACD